MQLYVHGAFELVSIYNRRIRLDASTMRPTRGTIASDHEAIRPGTAAQPDRTSEHIQGGAPMNTIDTGGRR